MSATGRTLPHSDEAEEYLLSCCMIDGAEVIPKCILAKVKPESFYDSRRGIIYDIALQLWGQKKPTGVPEIAEELRTQKFLENVGGYPYLTQVSGLVPTGLQHETFIEKVRDYAILRELIRSNTGIVEDCYGFSGDMPNFLSGVEKKFTRALTAYADDSAKMALETICANLKKEAEDMRDGKSVGDENDLSWGFADADRFLKKFRRGELVTIAARPGIGKSSLMRQIVFKNVVRDNKNVAVFTFEVLTDEYMRNTVQAVTGVNPREIAKYTVEDQNAYIKWMDRMAAFSDRLHIFDTNGPLAGLLASIRILHARKPLDLVAIDYLQLIGEKQDKGENRDMLLGRVTRALKQLALELKCVIIILSQLNRAVEREDRPPHLADLRESGNIEQDCDRVDFIHRPKAKPDGVEQKFDDDSVRFFHCDILQRKGRNVGEHSLAMNFDRHAARFLPIEPNRTHVPSTLSL